MSSVRLTPEQEAEAKILEERIRQAAGEEFMQLARLLVSKKTHEIFGQTEFQVRDILLRVGAKVYEEYLREKKNGYEGAGVTCPGCEQAAKFQGYRTKEPVSLFGPIACQRGYYYCGRCGHGLFPWDETVGLTPKRLTPAAEEIVSLAGTLTDSFAEAAEKLLPRMCGLRLSETTVQRTSEAAGQRLKEQRAAGHTLGKGQDWDWHKDAHGKGCAYVSLDLTGVRQQALDGSKADGRMPYVAMVYNPVPDLPKDSPYRVKPNTRMQARYLSGLYDLGELGLQMRRQAAQVGMERADRWIGLTDGGNGLENFMQVNFPRDLVLILDFWHASEYLADLAKLLHPNDEDASSRLHKEWSHIMKHEGGKRIVEVLQTLALPRKTAIKEKLDVVLNYFTNNLHRMDYPTYVANGWLIGSGSVESACKTVVGQRLKLAGMRWREYGTDAMCHMRALFKSETNQWEAFWRRSVN
jgi:hypothetical protein